MPSWNVPTTMNVSPVTPSIGRAPGGAFPGFISAPQAPRAQRSTLLEQIALAKAQSKLEKERAETAFKEQQIAKGWEEGEAWMGEGPEPIAEDMGYRKGPYGGQWKPPKPEIISAGGRQLLRTGPTTYTIMKPNTQVITKADEQGNVTAVGIDKDTGEEIFKKSLGKIGRPGRTGVQIGDIAPKVAARKGAETKAYLQTGKFRADVQKSVASLNKDTWDLLDPSVPAEAQEREDMVRVEMDKRVRMTYPKAKYGEDKGIMGWYVKEDNKWVLKVPWIEAP